MRAAIAIAVMLGAAPALAAAEDDRPPSPAFPTAEFLPGAPEALASDGGIGVRIFYERRPKIDRDSDVPVMVVTAGGRPVLETVGAPSGMDMPAATASIAEIDPYRLGKEVYFSSYSGGAHCCSRIIVAEAGDKGWIAIEVGSFDGDGDYLEDIDHDGVAEIVTLDDAFLYAFDCYACSAAPLVIRQIRDGKVVDVSAEPRYAEAHRAWLAELEAGADPDTRWTSPGFLAGWVAASARAGSGVAAFDALLDQWDAASDAGEQACLSGDDLDRCPKRDIRLMKFPDRLKLFLVRHGYMS